MQNARTITMMAGKRLPYDAEVEYLESTGTQWIDTGKYLTSASNVEVRAQIMGTGTSNIGLFSAGNTAPKAEFYVWGNVLMQFHYGSYTFNSFVIALNDIINISANEGTFTVENETFGRKDYRGIHFQRTNIANRHAFRVAPFSEPIYILR